MTPEVAELKLLVVDDEPGMRTGVERVLRTHRVRLPDSGEEVGLEVSSAASGEEALERIGASRPDVVLLDYMLPGMSGLDVLERAGLSAASDVLVIMISAYASIETALKAAKQGAYDFLAKPFTPDELKAAVGKAASHIVLQRQAARLAAEKRRLRFEFLSVLAHELKAPIGAIEGYLHLMKDRTWGTDLAAYDETIDRCLARSEGMRKLIVDLLDLTRIESGQKTRELVDLDAVDVARETIEEHAVAAAEHDVRVELHAARPVVMRADRGEIEVILANLVSNAVKYNRPGGRVDLTVERAEGGVKFRVVDTGVGMTPEETARLFGEFVRIRNARTRHVLGSGLGLSIVRKIAALYDGDVSVRSEPDVGSEFVVTLRDGTGSTP